MSAIKTILDKGRAILDAADNLLSGEPARAIGYGAALVVVGVSLVSNALGYTRIPEVSLDAALVAATLAITTLVTVIEGIRRSVYSPNTVDAIVSDVVDDLT